MGYSISWCAVQGTRGEILAAMNLRDAGEPDEYYESDFAAADFPSGWLVVVSQDFDYFKSSKRLAELSKGRRVVAVAIEEHVMFSSAEEWRDGSRIWMAEHSNEEGGVTHIESTGSMPERFEAIKTEYLDKQAGDDEVDFGFEIPLQTAKEIVAFKHDEGAPENAEYGFVRLELIQPEATAKRGLFGWKKG